MGLRAPAADSRFGGSIDEVGGTELSCQALLGCQGIHADDPRGTSDLEPLDHVEPHTTDTEDHCGLSWAHLGAIEHSTHAGEDATADEAG